MFIYCRISFEYTIQCTLIQRWSKNKNAIQTGVKWFRQVFKTILKKTYISAPLVLWALRLKTHFLLCTFLYLFNQKKHFAIVYKFFCGVFEYANQLFRISFDHFMAFLKKYKIYISWLSFFFFYKFFLISIIFLNLLKLVFMLYSS